MLGKVVLAAMLATVMMAFSAYSASTPMIDKDNHWRDSSFRPYVEDHDWGSNHVTDDGTEAKVLLFFSRNCSASVWAVKEMCGSSYLKDETVEVLFIDIIKSERSDISAMIRSYGLQAGENNIYYSRTSYPNQTAFWDYVSDYKDLNMSLSGDVVPATVIIDGNNKIRYAKNNTFSKTEVEDVIKVLKEEAHGEIEQPETGEPEIAVPETSEPETAALEETEPETTVPETAAPEDTEPETAAPETSEPETPAPEESDTITLYFMTGSSPDDPGDVFAEFEVVKNGRGNQVTLGNTMGSRKPEKEGHKFTYWQERSLNNPDRLGNRIYSTIWTGEDDQYIYAQYDRIETITLYFMTGSSPDDPGEVFAEYEVAKNARGNQVTVGNTIGSRKPQKEGASFAYWQEAKLSNQNVMGNRIYGTIWTGDEDRYIYAQYR